MQPCITQVANPGWHQTSHPLRQTPPYTRPRCLRRVGTRGAGCWHAPSPRRRRKRRNARTARRCSMHHPRCQPPIGHHDHPLRHKPPKPRPRCSRHAWKQRGPVMGHAPSDIVTEKRERALSAPASSRHASLIIFAEDENSELGTRRNAPNPKGTSTTNQTKQQPNDAITRNVMKSQALAPWLAHPMHAPLSLTQSITSQHHRTTTMASMDIDGSQAAPRVRGSSILHPILYVYICICIYACI